MENKKSLDAMNRQFKLADRRENLQKASQRYLDIQQAAAALERVAQEMTPEAALQDVLMAWMDYEPKRETFVKLTLEAVREWSKQHKVKKWI